MAFNKYVNGAWTKPEEDVQRYTNGAWQGCETAKRYKDGAWQDVWGTKTFFLKDGVLMNGGTYWNGEGIYARHNQNGYFEFENAFEYSNSSAEISFPASADLVGKTLCVVTTSASDDVRYGAVSLSTKGNLHYYKNLPSTTSSYYKVWFDVSGYMTMRIKDVYVRDN